MRQVVAELSWRHEACPADSHRRGLLGQPCMFQAGLKLSGHCGRCCCLQVLLLPMVWHSTAGLYVPRSSAC